MNNFFRGEVKSLMEGQLFVFEGPDNVGKSSAILELSRRLTEEGITHITCAFPGNTEGTLGKVIYEIHHNPERFGINALNPTSQQLLHIAAHIETIDGVIIPAIKEGKIVLLDRYWWSTWVYGLESNISREFLSDMIKLEKKYWGRVKPNILFLLRRKETIKNNISSLMLAEKYDDLALKEEHTYNVICLDNDSSIKNLVNKIEKSVGGCVQQQRVYSIDQRILTSERENWRIAKSPVIWNKAKLPKPSCVFDTYWRFAAERQEIFFNRFREDNPPWTHDEILQNHKFTNVYRASDRVSQYLIKKVIYGGNYSPDDLFFRIMLFKTFNKVETWELLEGNFGEIHESEYNFDQYDRVLTNALRKGDRIYSGAYIMASGRNTFGYSLKHQNHLRLIELMMKENVSRRILEIKTMAEVFDLLISYPTIGRFLAYQYCIDINYSEITNFSENEFVVPGPGASDGLKKCFEDFGDFTETDLIRLVTETQENEFKRLDIHFKDLWGRSLQLIDCQNLFCEVGKYARVAHPEIEGVSDRKRIKQKFKPSRDRIDYWYPPKWGINERIRAEGMRR